MAGGNLLETVMCLQSSPSWIVSPLSCSSNFPAPKSTVLQLKNPSEKSASKKKRNHFLTWIISLALALTAAAQTLVLVQLQES